MTNPVADAEALAAALREVEQLKGELQAVKQAAEPIEQDAKPVVEKVVDTVKHWLHLADGTVTESAGAVPTHVAKDDGTVVPVTAAYEQQKVSS